MQEPGRGQENEHARCRRNISPNSIKKLADEWGVSTESLELLEIGFVTHSYSFPMRDADGAVIGLRQRPFKDIASKHAAEGSRNDLFIPQGVTPANAQLLCEGESDTATGLTLRFATVGRPGTDACIDEAVSFFARAMNACPCIMADNGSVGKAGAEKQAEALLVAGIPCRILYPPADCSDLREWKGRDGLTPGGLAEAITDARILYPRGWPPNFYMVPNALVRRGVIAHLGTSAFSVLNVIASFADSSGICRVTREQLASYTGLSPRQIDRCNKLLKQAGFLSWRRGRTGRANEYRVDFGPCKESTRKYIVHPALDDAEGDNPSLPCGRSADDADGSAPDLFRSTTRARRAEAPT